MKLRILSCLILATLACMVSSANTLFPDSQTATNDVELGVDGIKRICPTFMWDSWIFRDIVYDKGNDAVVFVIQLSSWNESQDEKEITEKDAKKQVMWIVKNIMEGYNELKQTPHIMCDGDFMLYLSLGTLLNQMNEDGAALRINLLKPDGETILIPMSLTGSELKSLIK